MKNLLATAGSLLLMVVVVWGLLTLWVEAEGPAKSQTMGNPASDTKALIVYDPDPLYNLDEKVCKTFGKTLAQCPCSWPLRPLCFLCQHLQLAPRLGGE
jgi:hypothetical protein